MHYCKKYSLSLLLLFLLLRLSAQDTFDASSVESTTYQLYLDRQWKPLIEYSEKAIQAGYDYYYLRIRTGIACYETANYRKATLHFRRSLEFSAGDETACRYLYFAYLYAGQYEEARKFSRGIDSTIRCDMGIAKLSTVSFINVEAGIKASDSSAKFNPGLYTQFALQHYVANRFSLLHALTYYGQNEYRFNISQFQYYLGAGIPLRNNFFLSAGAHVLYTGSSYTETTYTDSTIHRPGPHPGAPPRPDTVVSVIHSNKITQEGYGFITSANIIKRSTYFDVGAGITLAYLDTTNQYQCQANVAYYPFGNQKFSAGAYAYLHTEDYFGKTCFGISPFVSSYLNNKLFVSANILFNRGNNITEYSGYLVNNSFDLTRSRFMLSASYRIAKKFYLYASYGFETKEEKYTHFTYHYQLALAGLRFTP